MQVSNRPTLVARMTVFSLLPHTSIQV